MRVRVKSHLSKRKDANKPQNPTHDSRHSHAIRSRLDTSTLIRTKRIRIIPQRQRIHNFKSLTNPRSRKPIWDTRSISAFWVDIIKDVSDAVLPVAEVWDCPCVVACRRGEDGDETPGGGDGGCGCEVEGDGGGGETGGDEVVEGPGETEGLGDDAEGGGERGDGEGGAGAETARGQGLGGGCGAGRGLGDVALGSAGLGLRSAGLWLRLWLWVLCCYTLGDAKDAYYPDQQDKPRPGALS
ncbi:hypothetical protein BC832DRAFT_546592 [Gaertneriomyces semiglobifer]|nr:hypothetical protein BC832DRAFT_546592 [Gaertneriomyces semiglobifer]